jgi:hypothetical protein
VIRTDVVLRRPELSTTVSVSVWSPGWVNFRCRLVDVPMRVPLTDQLRAAITAPVFLVVLRRELQVIVRFTRTVVGPLITALGRRPTLIVRAVVPVRW